MLKFFRTIRKKLIEQDNIRKYLFYAIGEILLVVIGILIALQISNWNEERVEKKLEKVYIQNMIQDLENQLLELNRQKEGEIITKASIYRTISKIDNKFEKSDIEEYNLDALSMMITRTLNLYDATFEDLKSTGNMNLIRNEQLKKEILDYFQFSTRYVYVIRKNAEGFHHFMFGDFMDSQLANLDVKGMNERVPETTLRESFNSTDFSKTLDMELNQRLENRLKEVDNLQIIKNAITNRRWTNEVSLLFLTEMELRTNELINELKKELN